MHLFYSENIAENQATLSIEESHHALKTLRHREGDVVLITDGLGFVYEGTISGSIQSKCLISNLQKLQQTDYKSPIHIFMALPKNPERFEWFLEKATEIGIGEVTPLITHRSEKFFAKPDRWNKILISAMKQSGRFFLPVLHPPQKLDDAYTLHFQTKLIAHCVVSESRDKLSELQIEGTTAILIGPEGDFTLEEINKAISNGFKPVSIGNARLRTETAGVVACTLLNFSK